MEPETPCTCITAHDRMVCVGWCKTLSPEDVLERRIRADRRNIDSARFDTSNATLACLVADCAVRWTEARKLGVGDLVEDAEINLSRIAEVWTKRCV